MISLLKKLTALAFIFIFPLPTCRFSCRRQPSPPPTNSETRLSFYPHSGEFTAAERAPDGAWAVSDLPQTAIAPDKKYIAFTFDDAPSANFESLIATFAAFNAENPDCPASATLFINGNRVSQGATPALSLADTVGLELGNHTYHHYNLTTLSSQEIEQEIQSVDKILQRIDGKPYHLLRAPFGKTNESVEKLSPTPIINWTIDTLDWTGVSADEIYQSVFSAKTDGSIILMHDGYPNTLTAVKRLLPDLKKAGYQVLSVSALSKANRCPLQRGKVYIRARKQQK